MHSMKCEILLGGAHKRVVEVLFEREGIPHVHALVVVGHQTSKSIRVDWERLTWCFGFGSVRWLLLCAPSRC